MRGDTPVCDVLVDLDHSGISLSLCAMATGEPIPTPEHDRVVDLSVPSDARWEARGHPTRAQRFARPGQARALGAAGRADRAHGHG